MAAIGKKLRPDLRCRPSRLVAKFRRGYRFAPFTRNNEQWIVPPWSKQDRAVCAPARADPLLILANGVRRSAGNAHLPEFAICGEANETAVWRPEWIFCAVCPRQQPRGRGIQRSKPERVFSGGVRRGNCEIPAIRRNRKSVVRIHIRIRWKLNRGINDR